MGCGSNSWCVREDEHPVEHCEIAVPVHELIALRHAWAEWDRDLYAPVNALVDRIPDQWLEDFAACVDRPAIRVIVNVEGGLVQNIDASAKVDIDVLDHDNFENCANTRGDVDTWTHEDDCEDHSHVEWLTYVALAKEIGTLPESVY